MNRDDLFEALGGVKPRYLAESEPKKQKIRPWVKWSGAVAAVLVAALLLGFFFGPGSAGAYALASPVYPKQARYPSGGLSLVETAHDAWWKDQRAQRAYFGAGEGLGPFLGATITEFLSGAGDQNRVYSPLNVYLALAMLAEVTEGESREEVLTLLGADSIEALRDQAHAVWNANYRDDGAAASILASSLWMDDSLQYDEDTVWRLADSYYASSFRGEMGSEGYNKALQSWMNQETGGLLKDQIARIELDPETVLAIVTTIYFKAKWSSEFQASQNTQGLFHSPDGDREVTFMRKTLTTPGYYWGEKFSAACLGTENGSFWMILPDEGVTPVELLSDEEAMAFLLSGKYDWENHARVKVNLSLPKFDVKSQMELKEGLKRLGVSSCFETDCRDFADFVKLDDAVYVSKVQHGARVLIDETGIEAAAYTEMAMAGSGAPPTDEVDFVLDRPFLFVLMSLDNLPLFVGVVNAP